MAKFIKNAIKNPGRETRRAKASGRSVKEQMRHDAHTKGNSKEARSLRSAGNLGLRLTGEKPLSKKR